jgi:hypothetical protein
MKQPWLFTFLELFFPVILNSGRWTKSRNPVILNVIHHCQNPLDSTLNVLCFQLRTLIKLPYISPTFSTAILGLQVARTVSLHVYLPQGDN